MNEARFFERDCLQQRQPIKVEIYKVRGTVFPRLFKKHYYLDLPAPIAAEYFVGAVDGEPVCHVAVCPKFESKHYRATRLVTMPEWQGAGIATRFLAEVCQMHLDGEGRLGKNYTTLFHTSHPQLCVALRHSKKWRQVSAVLFGGNKRKSGATIRKAQLKKGKTPFSGGAGYGGHFRAVQGFEYIGAERRSE